MLRSTSSFEEAASQGKTTQDEVEDVGWYRMWLTLFPLCQKAAAIQSSLLDIQVLHHVNPLN